MDMMVREFVQAGPSQGYWANLRTHARKYQEFCETTGVQPFPCDEDQACRYIAFLTLTLTSPDSVANYVSGLKKLHTFARLRTPTYSDYLNTMLMGVRRIMRHVIQQAEPFTPEILAMMASKVDQHNVKQVVCFTALLIGFFLFLRSSNLVPKSALKFDPGKQLIRADLRLANEVVLVYIKWSKTNQFGTGNMLVPLLRLNNIAVCPVTWLFRMLALVPAPANAPAFCVPTAQGLQALTYGQFTYQLKKWIQAINMSHKRFSSHSMHRGGASFAFSQNLPGESIRVLGAWASDCYLRYIQMTLDTRLRDTLAFANNI